MRRTLVFARLGLSACVCLLMVACSEQAPVQTPVPRDSGERAPNNADSNSHHVESNDLEHGLFDFGLLRGKTSGTHTTVFVFGGRGRYAGSACLWLHSDDLARRSTLDGWFDSPEAAAERLRAPDTSELSVWIASDYDAKMIGQRGANELSTSNYARFRKALFAE